MFGLTKEEEHLLRTLDSPRKIQSYLDVLPINHCLSDDTCLSPRRVMRERQAHCIEGAMFAALAFRMHGERPLILDLTSTKNDLDHVVALFRQHGCWGAVSKTNHNCLRYRDPIYRTIRELVLSYFHEYFDDNGFKTLRSYSPPVDLSRFDGDGWMTNEGDNWMIAQHLVDVRHIPLLTRPQIATLRRASSLEIEAGKLVEWQKPSQT